MAERDPLTHEIIGAAIAVSKGTGIGLRESVYLKCFELELKRRGFEVERQPLLPVVFEGLRTEQAFRPDIIVNRAVIVEVKAVSSLLPVHQAQLLNYLHLAQIPCGLLINFHALPFAKGIKRFMV
jgi:GxxExxY protein